MPTTHLDPIQAGAQITRENYHWGTTLGAATGPITFGFRQSATTNNDTTERNTFSQFTTPEMAAAETAVREWAALARISFTEISPSSYTNSATILFANYSSTTDGAQAYAYFPSSNNQTATSSQGDVWLNRAYENTASLPFGRYDFMTIVHEIGHALGLDHPGDYNAGPGQTITYANNAEYIEDTRQYTVMSYFAASNTGANHVYNGQTVYASTPLLDDITAIQRLYGANTSYATGNTVYGFNSNADNAYRISSSTQQVVYSVWDGGGGDTLDYSGYSTNQLIDLIPGTFSNVGALTMNVSIALGTIIESAIGGSGNDTFYGNGANNIIDGRGGFDTVIVTGAHNQYLATLAADGSIQLADQRAGAPDGSDTLINVEFVQFTDGLYSASQLAALSRIPVAAGNFSADNNHDVVWQDASGQATVTLMDGTTTTSTVSLRNNGPSWHIVGAGDFNGDGRADILWQNDSGMPAVWLMNGTAEISGANLRNSGPTWHERGAADFNGDGNADILWQNDNGLPAVWLMNGTAEAGGANFRNSGPTWHVAGIADFNGDGNADVLWQNDNGLPALWLMNGLAEMAGVNLRNNGPTWHIAAAADFNGDGRADILWHNDDGQAAIWLMNGTAEIGGANLPNNGPTWHIREAADFNGDGRADILWQDNNGQVMVSLMNGTTQMSSSNVLFASPPDSSPAPVSDAGAQDQFIFATSANAGTAVISDSVNSDPEPDFMPALDAVMAAVSPGQDHVPIVGDQDHPLDQFFKLSATDHLV